MHESSFKTHSSSTHVTYQFKMASRSCAIHLLKNTDTTTHRKWVVAIIKVSLGANFLCCSTIKLLPHLSLTCHKTKLFYSKHSRDVCFTTWYFTVLSGFFPAYKHTNNCARFHNILQASTSSFLRTDKRYLKVMHPNGTFQTVPRPGLATLNYLYTGW